ncbi:MAG: hypothetical protein QXX30_01655 [Candidatus Aenigmatarchaeota archaeon]
MLEEVRDTEAMVEVQKFDIISPKEKFVNTFVNDVPFNEKEIRNLKDDYVVELSLDTIPDFESGIVRTNIFSDKYIYYQRDLGLFLTFASSRFALFKVSDILHVLKELFNEPKVYVNNNFIKIYSDKLTYVNSYTKTYKEVLRYNPLLLNIINLKHTIKNINKRAIVDVVNELDKRINDIDFNQKLDDEDYELFISELGPRQIVKGLNLAISERELSAEYLKELRIMENLGEFISTVNTIHNKFPNNISVERGITNLSKNVIYKFIDKKLFENIL